ncbi:MAG: minor capsid protein, partial [Methanosarcina sp.]|nr:minor capsid protein [Methanosarcina sp.]
MDSLIDDLYLYTINYTDKMTKKSLKAGLQRAPTKRFLNAANADSPAEPLILTQEAVLEASVLADEVVESIIRVLKDEAIYQEHPRVLARRILDLWGGERYRAVRWARTFSADVATNTSLYRFTQQGIEECQFYAKIDSKTSPQCRLMHGTIWRVDSPEVKQYKCPLHHNCRSVILPLTSFSEIDDSLRYENRDFTKQVDQNFKVLDEGIDEKTMKKIFKEIDTFNEKWAVPSWVFDEDVEKRIAKLGVQVKNELPEKEISPSQIEAIFREHEKTIKDNDFETAIVIDKKGEMIFSKKGKESSVSFNAEELEKIKGNSFTHNHPHGTSFSLPDIKICLLYTSP